MLFSFILFAQAQQRGLLELLGFGFFVSIIGGTLLKLVIRWICKVVISNPFAFVQFLLFAWVFLLTVWIGEQIVPAAPRRLVSCVAILLSIVLASIFGTEFLSRTNKERQSVLSKELLLLLSLPLFFRQYLLLSWLLSLSLP